VRSTLLEHFGTFGTQEGTLKKKVFLGCFFVVVVKIVGKIKIDPFKV